MALLALSNVREPVQVSWWLQMSGSVRLPERGLARLAQEAWRPSRLVANRSNMLPGSEFR